MKYPKPFIDTILIFEAIARIIHKIKLLNTIILIITVIGISTNIKAQPYKYPEEIDDRIKKVFNFEFINTIYDPETCFSNTISPLDLLPAINQIILKTIFYSNPNSFRVEYLANTKLLERIEKIKSNTAEWSYVKTRLLINKTILHMLQGEYISALWSAYQTNSEFTTAFNKYPNYPPLHALAALYNFGVNSVSEYNPILDFFMPKPFNVNKNLLKHEWSKSEKPVFDALTYVFVNKADTNSVDFVAKTETDKIIYALYYLNLGLVKEAITITNQNISNNKPFDNYIKGWAYLTLGKYNVAKELFNKHIEITENIGFKRASVLGLYYINIINNNFSPNQFLEKLTQIPNSNIFRDKIAENEIKTKHHPKLLKARLFFDAQLYKEAEIELLSINSNALSMEYKLEYYYRYGRILYHLQDYNNSLEKYSKALGSDMPEKSYYKAQAAFDCGNIYLNKHDKQKARKYFNECINYAKKADRKDIENQAVAVLKELN